MWHHLRQLFKHRETRPLIVKTVVVFAIFVMMFYGTVSMAKSFFNVHRQKISKEKELVDINKRLETINSESIKNDDFQKEKIVREKLHMARPGEDIIIIIPKEVKKED